MIQTTKKESQRRSLLICMICSVIFFAATGWILFSDGFQDDGFPLLFRPSFALFFPGLILSPLLCLITFIGSLTLLIRERLRPFTAIIFWGMVMLTCFINETYQLRHLIIMSLSAVAMLAETYLRRLPKSQVLSAISAIALCVSYYFTVLFLMFSANV
jgi:hypothetical protein